MRPLIACLLIAPLLIGGCDRQSQPQEQANAAAPGAATVSDEAPPAAAVAVPPAGTVDRSHKGEPEPALSFEDASGKPVTLGAFRGKPVLLNLWATWCAPCVTETPTLDALAARDAGKLTVVAVGQEDDPAKVSAFFAMAGLKMLKPYLDPKLELSLGYEANLPTSVLFDAQGTEVWRIAGGMDWTGDKTAALIAEAR
ncbi:hypothetical protein BH09PSE4_BH09PSE4_12700 [soil metagenome]